MARLEETEPVEMGTLVFFPRLLVMAAAVVMLEVTLEKTAALAAAVAH